MSKVIARRGTAVFLPVVLTAALGLSGCADSPFGDRALECGLTVGGGALLGGLIGGAAAGNKGVPAGVAIGAGLGAAACAIILAMDENDKKIVAAAQQQALETGKTVNRTYAPAPGTKTPGARTLRVRPVPVPDREGFTKCREIHTDFRIEGVEGNAGETALTCRNANGDYEVVEVTSN
ncbi:hypothetical protein [Zavarzinia compransoris]|uniref:Glycine zipper domain-containing protein n=1 Tax=Zavarzinia compransoris TaxID=1264899 RepID=A0A317DXB1_9PROT|nr:hypothetical protein [Zavarzinia compransoris]PWR19004.1 hypothetical protein DKG75_18730 [Zavarzinia compransoris]TDP49005.1 hypothetical protein DES42_101366 [Zavarzinia compransoris]